MKKQFGKCENELENVGPKQSIKGIFANTK